MFIIGTTGHIDHGKSSLVQALTSMDPDRLPEEKQRGMTIDLGFAWLPFTNGETAGFIDVPGHKDFMKNVIAGLWGVNASILVVAADDGWMPQTEEHLNILEFFHITHGIVALSKVDLVDDPDWLDLVEDDIRGRLACTGLKGSRIIRVSARTGTNIDVLRTAIEELAQVAGQHRDIGRPRLYIDRAFTITGSGTVVTGTLIDGGLSLDQKVAVFPGGQECRIRGIESYSRKVDRGQVGCRVAVNLAGVKKGEIRRGDIVFDYRQPAPASRRVNARVNLIDGKLNLLKDKSEVLVYMGTRELSATIKLLQRKVLHAGETCYAQLDFMEPVATCIGDRIVLRRPSPPLTIGGGTILDPVADRLRYREVDALAALLERRSTLDLDELILAELEQKHCLPRSGLLETSRFPTGAIQDAVASLVESGRVIQADQWLVDPTYWSGVRGRLLELLAAKHREYPIEIGAAQAEILDQLAIPKELFDRMSAALAEEGLIRVRGAYAALADHAPLLTRDQEITIAEILKLYQERIEFPPTVREVLEVKPGTEDLIRYMCRQEMLVEMEEGVLFEAGRYREVRDRIIGIIQQNGSISIQTAREEFGYTRKYVLPLFNKLDSEGITRLKDNERVFTRAYLEATAGQAGGLKP